MVCPLCAKSGLMHRNNERRKKERPPAAAVLPKSNQVFGSGCECSSFLLPAPTEQTQRAEAGSEEREGGREWCGACRGFRPIPSGVNKSSRETRRRGC